MPGRTYESESWTSQLSQPSQAPRPSQPRPAARGHGYTQNHARYQDRLNAWSHKIPQSSRSGNVRDVVAVLVIMGVVYPRQKNITLIGVSVQRLL